MNSPPSSPAQATAEPAGRWLLEIVRGRDVGRVFALDTGETVVGNALSGQRGLDLLEQEGNSPRRMAPRHAAFDCSGRDLLIHDLESPGGTFVNQQRLLSRQPRKLAPDDVIQLGSVQLRVRRQALSPTPGAAPVTSPAGPAANRGPDNADPSTAPPPQSPEQPAQTPAGGCQSPRSASESPATATGVAPVVPGRLPIAFTMPGGAQCRTWDDFLVLAAQRWTAIRDELMSGRLTEYLRKIQRPDLVPQIAPDRPADDQLDDWLARLPASKKSAPELDVHPERLVIRAKTGGIIAGQSLRVSNVGYLLLRWTARVEPPDASWIRLRPEYAGRPVQTIEQTELPVDLELPDTIERPHRGHIVIESNGGTRRIEVRVERPVEAVVIPETTSGRDLDNSAWLGRLVRKVAGLPLGARLAAACLGMVALRLLMALLNLMPIGGAGTGPLQPRLAPVSIALVAAGAFLGLALVRSRGEARDRPAAAFAGGALGLLTAAFWFAVVQSVEKTLGSWSNSIAALATVWGALGALLALGSMIVIPQRKGHSEALP
jgi:hypothetical protein